MPSVSNASGPQLPTFEIMERNFSILLNAVQSKSDKISGNNSPALITDASGNIVAFFSSRKGAIEIPAVSAMRHVAAELKVPDLQGLGYNLYVLGNLEGMFEGSGEVNNFAPSNVHVWRDCRLEVAVNPASDDYKEAILRDRGVNIVTYESYDLRRHKVPLETKLTTTVDPDLDSLEKIYSLLEAKYSQVNFSPNTDQITFTLYQELMADLHDLAVQNVNLNGGPFAAAIIDPEGKLICVGSNRVFASSDPSMHGEVSALTRALNKTGLDNLDGYTVVTSSQTCVGCAETCARLGITRIIFGNTAKEIEENTSFSEGPLHPEFFKSIGIRQHQQIRGSDFTAFKIFMEKGKAYLEKQAAATN